MPQSLGDFLNKKPGIGAITSRRPSARERQSMFFQNKLFSDDREGMAKANRLMDVLDLTGANIPADAYDIGNVIAQRNPAGIAATGLAMFLGPMAKKADLSRLSQAQLLKEQGASRQEILEDTGWFQQKDGKWRFEISDENTTYRAPQRQAELGTVLQHKELYENYPELARMRVRTSDDPAFRGAYMGRNAGVNFDMNVRQDSATGRSTILHEAQHAVQDIEGFTSGANMSPSHTLMKGSTSNQRYNQLLNDYTRPINADEMMRITGMSYNDAVELVGKRNARIKKGLSPDEVSSLRMQAASEGYERNLGEVEARNTQVRRDMSAGQRRTNSPFNTQDVLESDVLVERQNTLDKFMNMLGLK